MTLRAEGSRALVAPVFLPPGPDPTRESKVSFGDLVTRIGRTLDDGERQLRRVERSTGADLSSAELIALQAGIYRYSEAVDLCSKLVDRATSGVKTVVQGQ
jgi:hypothetical protein